MKIALTRALVSAALNGDLDDVPFETDPVFGISIPQSCPGVPGHVLNPRNTWQDKAAYDAQAKILAGMFQKNFEKFANKVSQDVRDAGPRA